MRKARVTLNARDLTQIKRLLDLARYEEALSKCKALSRLHPNEFEIHYLHAKILGDFADELPPAPRKKLKRKAVTLLRQLAFRLRGQSAETRFGVRSNLYFHDGQFDRLLLVARAFTYRLPRRSRYAAAAAYALNAERQLRCSHDVAARSRAKKLAKKGQLLWETYFKKYPDESYYYPFTLLATCYAVRADLENMEKALRRASRLSKRPPDYWEFSEIRSLLQVRRAYQ